jgi:hypothetical protein
MIIVEKATDAKSMSEDLVTSYERRRIYRTGTNMPRAPVDRHGGGPPAARLCNLTSAWA